MTDHPTENKSTFIWITQPSVYRKTFCVLRSSFLSFFGPAENFAFLFLNTVLKHWPHKQPHHHLTCLLVVSHEQNKIKHNNESFWEKYITTTTTTTTIIIFLHGLGRLTCSGIDAEEIYCAILTYWGKILSNNTDRLGATQVSQELPAPASGTKRRFSSASLQLPSLAPQVRLQRTGVSWRYD